MEKVLIETNFVPGSTRTSAAIPDLLRGQPTPPARGNDGWPAI